MSYPLKDILMMAFSLCCFSSIIGAAILFSMCVVSAAADRRSCGDEGFNYDEGDDK